MRRLHFCGSATISMAGARSTRSVSWHATGSATANSAMSAGARLCISSIRRRHPGNHAYLAAAPRGRRRRAGNHEHLRQIAPEAFRAIQFRAVTERDWEEMALRHPDVAAAKASFRWTGSWHTVFVAIHPVDAANLRRLPGGGTELQPVFALADGEAY